MSIFPATLSLPKTANIVSRWRLDEASGNRADSVGSNTLTDNNTVGAGTGYVAANANFDNSADFERGNSEYLSIADNASLSVTDPLSISMLFNPETVAPTSYGLAGKFNDASQMAYLVNFGSTGNIEWIVSGDGSATKSIASGTTLSAATWYLITVVYEQSTRLEVYINGVPDGTNTTAIPANLHDSTDDFRLGAFKTGGAVGEFADGLMNDVIVWNAALSDAEVATLRNLYTVPTKGAAAFFDVF